MEAGCLGLLENAFQGSEGGSMTLRALLRKLLRSTEPDTEFATELSSRAVFPIGEQIKREWGKRGILVEDNPDTFRKPVDYDQLGP